MWENFDFLPKKKACTFLPALGREISVTECHNMQFCAQQKCRAGYNCGNKFLLIIHFGPPFGGATLIQMCLHATFVSRK